MSPGFCSRCWRILTRCTAMVALQLRRRGWNCHFSRCVKRTSRRFCNSRRSLRPKSSTSSASFSQSSRSARRSLAPWPGLTPKCNSPARRDFRGRHPPRRVIHCAPSLSPFGTLKSSCHSSRAGPVRRPRLLDLCSCFLNLPRNVRATYAYDAIQALINTVELIGKRLSLTPERHASASGAVSRPGLATLGNTSD